MQEQGKIFDRGLYAKRRNRRAGNWAKHDFFKREAAKRLAECMGDITRGFALALDLGTHAGEVVQAAQRVERWISCDMVQSHRPQVVCDEEWLPFAANSFDLVASALSLHHVNDLPGTLIQIRHILKPGGLFLGLMPGASSFRELRTAVVQASAEHSFPLSPRLSPFVEIRDAGALLMRAGFELPVTDSDSVQIEYDDAMRLIHDLRGMGESNVLLSQRKGFTSRTHLAAIAECYHRQFGLPDGTVPATFEFITMTGWKANASDHRS